MSNELSARAIAAGAGRVIASPLAGVVPGEGTPNPREPNPRDGRKAPDRRDFINAGMAPLEAALTVAPASVRAVFLRLDKAAVRAANNYATAATAYKSARDGRYLAAAKVKELETGSNTIRDAIDLAGYHRDQWGHVRNANGQTFRAGRLPPADGMAVKAALAMLAAAERTEAEARADMEAATEASNRATGIRSKCADIIMAGPVKAAEPATFKGPATAEALDAVRANIAGLAKAITATGKAPGTEGEAMRNVGEVVAKAARALRVIVAKSGAVAVLPAEPGGRVDALALMAAMFPAELTAFLNRRVGEAGEAGAFAGGLEPRKRAGEIERLTAEMAEAERVEESIVAALETAGRQVERRGEADPKAVLGIA